MNSPRPRTTLNAALKTALRLMRDYFRDGKNHIPLANWEIRKACRLLNVKTGRHGSRADEHWAALMREIGLDPETMEEIDSFRWAVAEDMIFDDSLGNTFPYDEFRRRLALAKMAQQPAALSLSQPDAPSQRRVFLENLGLELD
jgi:hypothetical protein